MASLEERQPTAPQAARRSVGCVFRNADGTSAPGAKGGLHVGGTAVCQRHATFICKTGKAGATDVRALIELGAEQRLYTVAAWHEAPFFNQRERAALALTDAVTLVADTHVPAEVYEQAAREFDPEELAQLLWQITTINAWNRIAVATRKTVGDYQPPARRPHPRVRTDLEQPSTAVPDRYTWM